MARPPALRVSPDRQVTASDIDCLKEAFALFDCDRDGEISVEELGKVGTALAWSLLCSSIRLNFLKTSVWGGKKHRLPEKVDYNENICVRKQALH